MGAHQCPPRETFGYKGSLEIGLIYYVSITKNILPADLWDYNMPTTIQVQDDVYAMLERLKRELNMDSHDQVIRYLIWKNKRIDGSEFGSMPGISPFMREEIDRFD